MFELPLFPPMALPRGRFLDLSRAPLVMAIVNCTPDSFWEGSRYNGSVTCCLEGSRSGRASGGRVSGGRVSGGRVDPSPALELVAQGADILDIGGESTRPGAAYVSDEEELERVLPMVEAIRRESDIPISVDTRKASVARAALDAGADLVNDISALEDDPALAPLVAARGVPVVLMHKKGRPDTMQLSPAYADAPREIAEYLEARARFALSAGIRGDRIILDPGFGFGKRVEDNLDILKELATAFGSGYPLLVGLSRKNFLGAVTGKDVPDRLAATLAANAIAMCAGAAIIRAHDAAETADAAALVRALRARTASH